MEYDPPKFTDLVIATLFSARSTGIYKKILHSRNNANSARMTFWRLKKKGYIDDKNGEWVLTKKGERRLQDINLLSYIPSPFSKGTKHDTLISFDIPQTQNRVRNWLRNQIKIFGYEMLQQSLWKGPGPLPKSFFDRIEKLKISNNVKTFKIINEKK